MNNNNNITYVHHSKTLTQKLREKLMIVCNKVLNAFNTKVEKLGYKPGVQWTKINDYKMFSVVEEPLLMLTAAHQQQRTAVAIQLLRHGLERNDVILIGKAIRALSICNDDIYKFYKSYYCTTNNVRGGSMPEVLHHVIDLQSTDIKKNNIKRSSFITTFIKIIHRN